MLSVSRMFKLLLLSLPPAFYPYCCPLLKSYILEKAKPNTDLGFLFTILSPKERQKAFNTSAMMQRQMNTEAHIFF